MRAAVIDGYGGAEKLEVREVPEPGAPGTGQVRVRVRAASLNPLDWKVRNGSLRFVLPKKFPLILGFDVAGEVEAVGPEVTRFEPGDPVFGQALQRHAGGHAEAVLMQESALAHKPESLSFEEAAALPMAGLTALQALRDKGEVATGERVLINGAAGGVGHFAVMIARVVGARVTAVASGRNQDFVRQLGAERAIDYQEEDFTADEETYEVIFDAVGTSSYRDCEYILADKGVYVSTLAGPAAILAIAGTRLRGLFGEGRRAAAVMVRPDAADLELLAGWADRGRLRPHVERVFSLDEIRAAHEASESGHTRGKIVVRIG
jgi:NADPH:quinone reductase-like Zn-dependent oxidoreductase